MAKAPELKLKEGDPAPTFTAVTSGGGKISLADYLAIFDFGLQVYCFLVGRLAGCELNCRMPSQT